MRITVEEAPLPEIPGTPFQAWITVEGRPWGLVHTGLDIVLKPGLLRSGRWSVDLTDLEKATKRLLSGFEVYIEPIASNIKFLALPVTVEPEDVIRELRSRHFWKVAGFTIREEDYNAVLGEYALRSRSGDEPQEPISGRDNPDSRGAAELPP